MAIFAVDASVALAWCFEDEASTLADGLLYRLRGGDQTVVPAHWPTEVSNGLLIAERRKRIKTGEALVLCDELWRLSIETEPPLALPQTRIVLTLAEKHRLTVYDAAYLELAQRRRLPLGTLDADLRQAAQREGIAIL